ncbi:MAG: hypothetical protein J6K13_03015 [Clostridia bacterium]|nr:hypothetical protein [Clostridia bacterium]
MKRKRLDRDKWGFQGFPYAQMRVDLPEFHGMASMIQLLSGDYCYWETPKAGKVPVCGKGMTWLQLVPDDQHRLITVKYLPNGKPSLWYVDVIITPQGDVKIDDREELEAAYASGDMTEEQYRRTLAEGEKIVQDMCTDIRQLKKWCKGIYRHVQSRLQAPDTFRKNEKRG